MKVDITKYLKNADIKIKNDDFDIETMSKDLTAGLYSEELYNKAISDSVKLKEKELTDKFSKEIADKDNAIASLTKTSDETNGKVKEYTFKTLAYEKGFKKDDIERVSRLCATYSDLDQDKALETVATEYKQIFFPDTKPVVPNDSNPLGAGGVQVPATVVSRKSSYDDLAK